MSAEILARQPQRPAEFGLPSLLRNGPRPLAAVEHVGRQAAGRVARLDLGRFHPFLITDPAHVQHVLRDNSGNYPRGDMMWRAFGRLTGAGIAGEGPDWRHSRDALKGAFSAARLDAITDQLGDVIVRSVEELRPRAAAGEIFDAGEQMTRLVQRAADLAFFGSRVPAGNSARLGAAIKTAMGSFMWRMLAPSVPLWLPMPGDLRFHRAVRTVTSTLDPILSRARCEEDTGAHDVISLLLRTNASGTAQMTDKQVRDDIVALFVAGSESSSVALTWLWAVLHEHPLIAERMRAEIDQVVGTGVPELRHVRQLRYTQMVLSELLRVHSVGWIVPRTCLADDVIGDVPVPAGATVMFSPYLTHRLPGVWPDPDRFDPERFAQGTRIRPFSYLPFGAGPHMCLGRHFFSVEATLIVAALLARFDAEVHGQGCRPEGKARLTVQPRRPVLLTLTPR